MSAHFVRLAANRGGQTIINKSDACVVWVDDASVDAEADARAAAAANYGSPADIWADAEVTELVEANLASPIRVATT
jgi:hypothetical protein